MSSEESEGRIVRYTAEEFAEMRRRGETLTDWERVRNMTDEEIEASIDFKEEGEFDFDVLYLARGRERTAAIVTFRCDIDLLKWFQEHSDSLEAEISQVLSDCAKEQRDHAER